jgi:hypothetical protein
MHTCEKWVRFAKKSRGRIAEGAEGGLWVVAAKRIVVGLLQVVIGRIIAQMFYLVKSQVQHAAAAVESWKREIMCRPERCDTCIPFGPRVPARRDETVCAARADEGLDYTGRRFPSARLTLSCPTGQGGGLYPVHNNNVVDLATTLEIAGLVLTASAVSSIMDPGCELQAQPRPESLGRSESKEIIAKRTDGYRQ